MIGSLACASGWLISERVRACLPLSGRHLEEHLADRHAILVQQRGIHREAFSRQREKLQALSGANGLR